MGFGLGKEHSTFLKIPSRALMLLLRARMLRRALLSCHVTLLVRGGVHKYPWKLARAMVSLSKELKKYLHNMTYHYTR